MSEEEKKAKAGAKPGGSYTDTPGAGDPSAAPKEGQGDSGPSGDKK